MDVEHLLTRYLACLETGRYEDIVQLFTEDAVVHSPLYGEVRAAHFYRELLKDTQQSKITVLHVFSSQEAGAVHFVYEWVLKDGTPVSFECVDVIEVSQGKIKNLTIIYDTYGIRTSFEKMKLK